MNRQETAAALADVLTNLAAAVKAARGVGLSIESLKRMATTEWQLQARRDPTPIELAAQRRRARPRGIK